MARITVFADEAGNFDFSLNARASRYFILTTIQLEDCSVGDALLAVRRQLAWEGAELHPDGFHASEDKQAVRDQVFAALDGADFRIDATILDKRKTQPRFAQNEAAFYQLAWYLHFKFVAPRVARTDDELLVIAASLGTKSRRTLFFQGFHTAVVQTTPTPTWRTASWPAATDPCLWVADYCCWAIQRKWERGDERSYVLVKDKIRSEFEAFRWSSVLYY